MASRRPTLPRGGQLRLVVGSGKVQRQSICPVCSHAPTSRPKQRSRRDLMTPRHQSTTANATQRTTSGNPRAELEHALLELQKQVPDLLNISRVQLALQGLRQAPGEEVVRIAVLGLANDSNTGDAARRVLRALLADPLQDEESWERQLASHEPDRPLIVRVGPTTNSSETISLSRETAIDELHVSSPELNHLNIEFLLMNVNAPYGPPGSVTLQSLEDAVLVPTVDLASNEAQVSLVATPVHQAILVGTGLSGAVNISAFPIAKTGGAITTAVDFKGVTTKQLNATFNVVDVSLAEQSIGVFRQGTQHGIEYERLWFASNLPALTTWLNASNIAGEQSTKPAVRQLIASLLNSTLSSIQAKEAHSLSQKLADLSALPTPGALGEGLSEWAQKAHTELQEELDLAFTGRRWQKLGWWKLFWRVDDVAMLTNEMLGQRFMPTAEQELVYLTGRVAGLQGALPRYPQPVSAHDASKSGSEPRKLGSGELAPAIAGITSTSLPKWPGHIAFTRRYLQNETVPALQSLAQRLVIQSLGTSSVTTSLAALLYVSSFVSTLYEAGAVAALGIVYSLSRMQKKWETARGFWEGEVREEGRKAVRAAEESVADALQGKGIAEASAPGAEELQKARELVTKAEDALARMK